MRLASILASRASIRSNRSSALRCHSSVLRCHSEIPGVPDPFWQFAPQTQPGCESAGPWLLQGNYSWVQVFGQTYSKSTILKRALAQRTSLTVLGAFTGFFARPNAPPWSAPPCRRFGHGCLTPCSCQQALDARKDYYVTCCDESQPTKAPTRRRTPRRRSPFRFLYN